MNIFDKVEKFILESKQSAPEPIFAEGFPNSYERDGIRINIFGEEDWQWDENSEKILEFTDFSRDMFFIISCGKLYKVENMAMRYVKKYNDICHCFNTQSLVEELEDT